MKIKKIFREHFKMLGNCIEDEIKSGKKPGQSRIACTKKIISELHDK